MEAPQPANEAVSPPPSTPPAADTATSRWHLRSTPEVAELALLPVTGPAALRLVCPAGQDRLIVNVPAFRPVGSEERLSFGSGGEVVALVADTAGDAVRGGVSGAGEVPADLPALVGGPIAVNYGAQDSGPHPAPPAGLARAFVAACRGSAPPAASDSAGSEPVSACLIQDGERLQVSPLRAVGTEPFWAARIEGRCVTYSHPEDQDGTRVWTRYEARPDGAAWSGALDGRPFVLRTRRAPGCSDGMSDKRYPLAVEVVVNGERRTGCAELL